MLISGIGGLIVSLYLLIYEKNRVSAAEEYIRLIDVSHSMNTQDIMTNS